ncbi:MAG TPA: SLBB domain-containing protein [Ktedonobacterales bacterium]
MALQPQKPQPRQRNSIADMLRSRSYYQFSLALTVVLLAGIAISLMMRSGAWPTSFVRPQPITITGATAAPTVTQSKQLHVYVLGAVRVPAAYTLQRGSHVRDLIAAAGGAHSTADITRVDANALLDDGQSVYVPALDETLPPQRAGKLDLNAANPDQLHRALAISVTVGRQIVVYRTQHGNFTAVSQLLLVPVTRVTYDRIKDLVAV